MRGLRAADRLCPFPHAIGSDQNLVMKKESSALQRIILQLLAWKLTVGFLQVTPHKPYHDDNLYRQIRKPSWLTRHHVVQMSWVVLQDSGLQDPWSRRFSVICSKPMWTTKERRHKATKNKTVWNHFAWCLWHHLIDYHSVSHSLWQTYRLRLVQKANWAVRRWKDSRRLETKRCRAVRRNWRGNGMWRRETTGGRRRRDKSSIPLITWVPPQSTFLCAPSVPRVTSAALQPFSCPEANRTRLLNQTLLDVLSLEKSISHFLQQQGTAEQKQRVRRQTLETGLQERKLLSGSVPVEPDLSFFGCSEHAEMTRTIPCISSLSRLLHMEGFFLQIPFFRLATIPHL